MQINSEMFKIINNFMSYFDLDSQMAPPIDYGFGGPSAFDDIGPNFDEGDMIEFDDQINRVVDYDDYELQGVLGANSDINLFQNHYSPYYQKTLLH